MEPKKCVQKCTPRPPLALCIEVGIAYLDVFLAC